MRRLTGILCVGCLLVWGAQRVCAENWPAWRGPTGLGVTAESSLPVHWDRETNVKWRVRLPGPGNSTPIVWGDRVFITQAREGGQVRSVLCFDREDGRLLWERWISFTGDEPTHRDNPYCSQSPVTDGERVVAWHGSAGVVCYSLDGKELWRRYLGPFRHIWGNASSPVIHGDLVILNCGPGPRTFLIALNKQTGETVWRVNIPGGLEGGTSRTWIGSWSTPVIASIGGRTQIVMSFPLRLQGFDVATGRELWRHDGLGRLVYTSPLVDGNTVVGMSGYMGPAMAVRVEQRPDGFEAQRLWLHPRNQQRIGSGVIHEGHVYLVNEPGVAQCIELASGKVRWQARLGARSWSSCVLTGDGLIYNVDQQGETFIFRANPEKFELVSRCPLSELTRASIAVSDGDLFIRTYESLWCIGEPR